jgi:hypothetical protein
MSRPLGVFERALAFSDRYATFNVAIVLRMENAPAPAVAGEALAAVQAQHPLLGAAIRNGKYVPGAAPPPVLDVRPTGGESDWLSTVEAELDRGFDPHAGPLHRMIYLTGAGRGDLLWVFYHSILDGASAVHVLDEFLRLCAGTPETRAVPRTPSALAPAAETQFPASARGLRGGLGRMRYALAQSAEQAGYLWHTRNTARPAIAPAGHSRVLADIWPEPLVAALTQSCRQHGVTLNSLLNAALVLAVNRRLRGGRPEPMQTFTFADLRAHAAPPDDADPLVNYASMLRLTVPASGVTDIWALARDVQARIYHALKTGDKYHAHMMAETTMRMFVALKSMRMGAAALSYAGTLPLSARYGDITLTALHAFVSSINIGPLMSAQARLFDERLWLDFSYFDGDMDHANAGQVVAEMRSIAVAAANSVGAGALEQ